jgi:hypothetical protein
VTIEESELRATRMQIGMDIILLGDGGQFPIIK